VVKLRLFARLGARDHFSARPEPDETLLDVAARLGVPLGQACAGLGVCGSCGVRVLHGMEHLSEVTLMERKNRTLDLDGGWRLTCQALLVEPAEDAVEPAEDAAEPADEAAAPADDNARQVHLWHPAWGLPLPEEADS